MSTPIAGAAAALWLGSLWFIAPIANLSDDRQSPVASRIRDAISLGVVIPFALALIGALTALNCEVVACSLIVIRFCIRPLKFARPTISNPQVSFVTIALPFGAITATTWPQVVRPLLNGDSLAYHLPNAASWANSHSLWTSGTWYWWYPGASELFAAGLLSIGGPLCAGFAGVVALVLLSARLYAFAKREGCPDLMCATFTAWATTLSIIALQAGSLENDVWLAAFVLEIVWLLREDSSKGTIRAAMVTSLIKPYGFVFAAIAIILSPKCRLSTLAIASIPFCVWVGRDALLWSTATIPPASVSGPPLLPTTIFGHGFAALPVLALAVWHAGPGVSIAFCAMISTMLFSSDSALKSLTAGTFLFFLAQPYGYQNNLPQLATGASLRYADTALILGLVGALPYLRRVGAYSTIALSALACMQVISATQVFRADSTTFMWYEFAAGIMIAIAADQLLRTHILTSLTAMSFVAYAIVLAGSHPVDYYNDGCSHGTYNCKLYSWLATMKPHAVISDSVLLGSIAVISPSTLVENASPDQSCVQARRSHAWFIIKRSALTSAVSEAQERSVETFCGTTIYRDAEFTVIDTTRIALRR